LHAEGEFEGLNARVEFGIGFAGAAMGPSISAQFFLRLVSMLS
jgi:hypothetical protein